MRKFRLFLVLIGLVLILGACKSSDAEKQDTSEKQEVQENKEKEPEDEKDSSGKTPDEILEEATKEIEEKTKEVEKKNKELDDDDLTIDLSEWEYWTREEGDDEKYYPQFNSSFDDYSKYSYTGVEEVKIEPRSYEDMTPGATNADRDKSSYQYKGRREDLFSYEGKNSINMHDSAPYKFVFGYDRPSKEVLHRTLENNTEIPEKYKEEFKKQIDEWMDNNEGVNLTLLNENLYTLQVMECTDRELVKYALNINALACYRKEENTIYVLAESDFDDEFKALLRHEFAHAARNYINKHDGTIQVMATFYPDLYNALYADEGLATLFTSYENKGRAYPLITNCYRIITDACHYTVSDYMAHSFYELRDKVNFYLSDIAPADDILKGIEHLGQYVYDPIEKAKNNLTEEDMKKVIGLMVKICLKENPGITPEAILEKLESQIKDHKTYEGFLNIDVIKACFE